MLITATLSLSTTLEGFVVPGAYYPTVISSGVLNPVKTRRLLQVSRKPAPIATPFQEIRGRVTEALIRIGIPANLGTRLYPRAQILLALGKNSSEIRTEFEEPLKSYINFNITSAY